jgi:nickel-dependent lactate racemase
MMVEVLSDAGKLDFMVALGTHPPLDEASMLKLVGITRDERLTHYGWVGLHNHNWNQADSLEQIGTLTQDRVKEIAGAAWHPSLGGDVPVRINRSVKDYDRIIILGPTFPHEVVGFSGGAKYLFPGISGPEMINVTHWLGALLTSTRIIGTKETAVRTMINAAAKFVKTPITLVSLVVVGDGLAGIFVGDLLEAWGAAADLSSKRHITWVDKPYQRVLAWAPSMYDELWTAGKAMYKTDPAVANGGEIIIFAPHLDTISRVHGKHIFEIGYHPLDYFLKQWDKFKHVPLGVLAHSTHVRGGGTFENGVEKPRIKVTLASQISAADCKKLSLGYLDPASVRVEEWQGKAGEGRLYVPKAGEMLYRVKP